MGNSEFIMTPSDQYGRRNSAFSLVELVMVMAAIVVLVGIVIGGTRKMMDSARESNTRALLRAMSAIATEYEVQTGRKISHIDEDDDSHSPLLKKKELPATITQFVQKAQQVPATRKMLESLDSEFYTNISDTDTTMHIKDAWGVPLIYMRKNINSGTPEDPSGTGVDPFSKFLPEHHDPFFSSAGPDNEWGNFLLNLNDSDPANRQNARLREDNLYSFELD